jgi:hypothetical protein
LQTSKEIPSIINDNTITIKSADCIDIESIVDISEIPILDISEIPNKELILVR